MTEPAWRLLVEPGWQGRSTKRGRSLPVPSPRSGSPPSPPPGGHLLDCYHAALPVQKLRMAKAAKLIIPVAKAKTITCRYHDAIP
jgi:hypothetical protein